MGKVKKILAGVLVVVIAGSGITAGLMQLKKNSQKTVAVTPVSGLLQEFYTPSTTLDGNITSSATQTVNGDKDLIIDQIYVTKGDAVKKGDPLVSFDTTLVEMELNIAKLKKQKLEQDLNKAVNRLNSLQNGGPVEETDAGTDADNLNSKTGSTNNDTGDDDMTPDNTLSSTADMSGNYLAAAMHPFLLSAFTDGDAVDNAGSDNSSSKADLPGDDASTDTGNTGGSSDGTSADNDTPVYSDPSANGFSDGEKDDFNSGKMIHRNYHQRQRQHWMIVPHILILITEKVIRISQMVTSRFIKNWMQIPFRLQEVAQRTIHMYICVAVQKKK